MMTEFPQILIGISETSLSVNGKASFDLGGQVHPRVPGRKCL